MENDCTRRDLMKGMGVAALALGLDSMGSFVYGAEPASPKTLNPAEIKECKLPPLNYLHDALEPYIDKETLEIHHTKHHGGYVKKFNIALKKLEEARTSNDFSLIKHWSRELAFNGSGHILHTLYWGNMTSHSTGPAEDLLEKINQNFTSFNKFKAQFIAAATSVEGSGWGILGYEPYMGNLVILQAEKHQDLAMWGVVPLLVCDVWEHAYYLKYKNDRGAYVQNFFKIIDWKAVERRYNAVKEVLRYR